jgi:hypothetical protein
VKQKYIILWSLLPVIILITSLYAYREYKTIKSVYFNKTDLLQQRSSNPYKPNKVMIGSSIANSIVSIYPKIFYSYGISGCGHVVGMRYFLTKYALDNSHSADIYFMAMNEHWGDGIFSQYLLDQPLKGGGVGCKKIFDNLQQRYPIPEYITANDNDFDFDFDFFFNVLNGQRGRYQKKISKTSFPLKYFYYIFRAENTALKNDNIKQQNIKIHPLADKYLRKSIDLLLENNKKVVIIRLPQGDEKIKIEGKKVAVLKDYMLQLQKDYGDKIYSLDYLYKFTGKPIKDFGLHLDYKPYLDILQNDIQEDLTRLLHHSNTI